MIGTWILTYAVHSTVLLGAAWVLAKIMPEHWHAGREALWKSALLVGVASTSLTVLSSGSLLDRLPQSQAVTTIGPLALAFAPTLAESSAPEPSDAESSAQSLQAIVPVFGDLGLAGGDPDLVIPSGVDSKPVGSWTNESRAVVPARPDGGDAGVESPAPASCSKAATCGDPWASLGSSAAGSAAGSPATSPTTYQTSRSPWSVTTPSWASGVLLLLTCLGGTLSIGRGLRSWVGIRRCLGERRALTDGPLYEDLKALCARVGHLGGVRLTDSPEAPAPLALGLREICVPAAALGRLTPEERHAALAHELAHLIRRDPIWFTGLYVLETFFFFLPLHRVARRRIQAEAEFLCDDWATARTGSRLDLARCLAKVAEWSRSPAPQPTASMAGISPLLDRVRRLLEPERTSPRGSRPLTLVGVVGLAGLLLLFGPRFVDTGEAAVARPSGARTDPAPLAPAPPVMWTVTPNAIRTATPSAPARSPRIWSVAPSAAPLTDVHEVRGAPMPLPVPVAVAPDVDVEHIRDAVSLATSGLLMIPEDFGDVIVLPDLQILSDDSLGSGNDRRFTMRVDDGDRSVALRFEDEELRAVEMNGQEIPESQYDYDGDTLVVWDEPRETAIFEADIPRVRILADELRDLRLEKGALLGLQEDLRGLGDRKSLAESAYREALGGTEALRARLREQRKEVERRNQARIEELRLFNDERGSRNEDLQRRLEAQRSDSDRTEELRQMARELRAQKRSLELHLEELERQLRELELEDPGQRPNLRYWEGEEPGETDDPGAEDGSSIVPGEGPGGEPGDQPGDEPGSGANSTAS